MLIERLPVVPLRIPQYDVLAGTVIRQNDSSKISYRSTLLQTLHPDADYMFLSMRGFCNEAGEFDEPAIATALAESYTYNGQTYTFDFATGSRKHGLFLASTNGNIASRYFKHYCRRVSHGSVLSTNCHRGMYRLTNVKVLVIDEEKDSLSSKLAMGDCFGLASRKIAKHFDSQVQFRAGVRDAWIAKGCLLPCDSDDLAGADIILPLSSFKGWHPPVNEIIEYPEMYLGVHLNASARQAKASHTGLVWFTSDDAKQHLLDLSAARIDEINAARTDIKATIDVCSQGVEISDEGEVVEESYQYDYLEDTLYLADHPEQLHHHPKVMMWLNGLYAKAYNDATLNAGITGTYLMAAPMEFLPDGFVVSWSLPSGPAIMQRYPIRGRVDLKQVTVINPSDLYSDQSVLHLFSDEYLAELKSYLEQWRSAPLLTTGIQLRRDYTGNFFVNPKFFATVGGDFDGDCALFLDANQHYPLYKEIGGWKLPPEPTKPPKAKIDGTVYEIAAGSTSNAVGLVTWLNILRWILKLESFSFDGGETYVDLDVWFADQLQKAVDGYKTGVTVDEDGLDAISKYLFARIRKQYGKGATLWLKDYKQRKHERRTNNCLWQHRPSSVNVFLDDVVSQMIRHGISCWHHLQWKPCNVYNFRNLFSFAKPSDEQLKEGVTWAKHMGRTTADIFGHIFDDQGDLIASELELSLAIECYHNLLEEERQAFSLLPDDQRMQVAAARWRAYHSQDKVNSKRMLHKQCTPVFYVCQDELTEALNEIRATFFKAFVPKGKKPSFPEGEFVGSIKLNYTGDQINFDLYHEDQWVAALRTYKLTGDASMPWINAQLPMRIREDGKGLICELIK